MGGPLSVGIHYQSIIRVALSRNTSTLVLKVCAWVLKWHHIPSLVVVHTALEVLNKILIAMK